MKKIENLDDLIYEWPSNLSQYEAKIFLGLTATEAMGSSMAFLLPIGVIQSGFGFIVGFICCIHNMLVDSSLRISINAKHKNETLMTKNF